MGSLTRRLFLGRAAASSVVLAPAVALAHPVVAESAELVALGEQLDALQATYRAAAARKRAARKYYEQQCPVLPDDLVCKRDELPLFAGCTDREQDIAGIDVWPTGEPLRPPRQIFHAGLMQQQIDNGCRISSRSKFGRRYHALMKQAREFEAERIAVLDRSGWCEAYTDTYHAAAAIDALAWQVRETTPPVTMAGVLIHARVLAAHAESEKDGHSMPDRAALTLGRPLAEAVLRIAAVQS